MWSSNLERGPKRWWRDSLHLPRTVWRLPEGFWMMRQHSANYTAMQKLASLSWPLFPSLSLSLCGTFSNEHPVSSVKGTSSSQSDTISAVMEAYLGQQSAFLWQVFVSSCVENLSHEVVVTICTGGKYCTCTHVWTLTARWRWTLWKHTHRHTHTHTGVVAFSAEPCPPRISDISDQQFHDICSSVWVHSENDTCSLAHHVHLQFRWINNSTRLQCTGARGSSHLYCGTLEVIKIGAP